MYQRILCLAAFVAATTSVRGESPPDSLARYRVLEDKLHSIEVYKIKPLEDRLRALENRPLDTAGSGAEELTPLIEGPASLWGRGVGFGVYFGTTAGNSTAGVEAHIIKLLLPAMERPLTHAGLLGFAVGSDFWANTGQVDNEKWGIVPYLKVTANSMLFENYFRIYASVEPLLVYGYLFDSQQSADLHAGFKGAFGSELYASRHYNFFAEVGVMKSESIDGSSPNTGFSSVIRAGPRFFF